MVADFNIKDVVYSEISMAVFEDSGWYQVKYNMLDKPIWGNQKGCKFVREKCLKDEIPNFSEFSTEIQFSHCDYKHLRKGYSNLKDNSHKLPIAYQYFSNEYLGSNDHFLDFCPVIEPLKSGNCRETRPDYQKIDVNIGENMCEDCRCVEGDYYKNIETS